MSREQQLIDRLVAERDAAGLFFDFDGTLSEIAPMPEEAAPIEGAADVL
jgi:trehalose-6-phosphatase